MATLKQYGIGGAVGIGIGLVATAIQWQYPEYKGFAKVLFLVGGLLIFGSLVAWLVRWSTIREFERAAIDSQGVRSLPQPVASQNLNQNAAINNTNVNRPEIHVHQSQSQSQEIKESRSVALMLTHELAALPLVIPSGGTMWVLPLLPTRTESLLGFRREGGSQMIWCEGQSQFIERCVLYNHGTATLLNLTLDFPITFYKGNSTDEADIVSRHLHRIGISVVKPEIPFIFYLVNQSRFLVKADFPTEAHLQIAGETERRTAAFTPRGEGIDQLLQNMPSSVFAPSQIEWDNPSLLRVVSSD